MSKSLLSAGICELMSSDDPLRATSASCTAQPIPADQHTAAGSRGLMRRRRGANVIALLLFAVCGSRVVGHAATIAASSCSQSAVQSAINSASSGDTVTIPSGTCTWSSTVSVTKAISIKGAGIGSTVINGSINAPYGTGLVEYAPTSTEAAKVFELSGITCNANYQTGCLHAYAPSSTVAITGMKIHDNRFLNGYSRAIILEGLEFGVFYQNQFQDNYIAVSGIGVEMSGWNYPYAQGGANYPFFEDNTFTQTVARGGFIVETGRGGRIVFRHNTINGYGGAGGEVWDAHGVNGTYPTDTGTVTIEYYNNSVGLSASSRVLNHRGGRAIVFNNSVTGSGGINMTEYQGWSYCTSSPYPKPQQVNNSYYWGNTAGGSAMTPSLLCTSGGCSSCNQNDSMYIQLNRDYWLPSSGLDASKPSTCSVGARYGATDTGKLYACNTTNVWTTIYTPYTYPHPLRTTSSPPPPSPAPPTNLQSVTK